MIFFSNEFISFFEELENNNNREWFNQNKKNFIHFVKEPFENFIEVLINEIKEYDESIELTTKEAIFRIYKDVRFSKDKTPYKTTISAVISEGGKKDFTTPGVYLELGKNGINFYSGVHFLEREQLQNLREFINDNLDGFHSVIEDKIFKQKFSKLLGTKNKRIPSDFKELCKIEPLIANKQFYVLKQLSANKLLSQNLIKTIMELYQAGKPLNNFLKLGIS